VDLKKDKDVQRNTEISRRKLKPAGYGKPTWYLAP